MIPYIIQRFHQRHREQLPELILLAEKVERVHAAKPTCPKGLAAQLNTIYQDLSQHMMKEEQILFPMIQQGMGAQASGPIRVMEMEHDRAGNDVEAVKIRLHRRRHCFGAPEGRTKLEPIGPSLHIPFKLN
ncbi:hypothetical protein SOASR029_32510 [Budvicia aquatica]|nr:hypothetical protein SOASR029_32510 [Budvicia aquatica]